MKTALLVPDPPSSWTPPIFAACAAEFSAEVFALTPGQPLPDLRSFDLVVSRLKFRHLAAMESIEWHGIEALKIHWDEDGFWDGLWSQSTHRGLWSENWARLGFDHLVVTGYRAQTYFLERGIPASVVHKGFSANDFDDFGGHRRPGLAMYGQEYPSRILARKSLTRAGLTVRRLDAPYKRLCEALNGWVAALVCTLDARVRGGKRLEPIAQTFPRLVVHEGPGPEPMLKLFESAASGCATFTDASPDLADLGFIDGETVIIYEDIDQLVDKARFYLGDVARLRAIGRRGSILCRERHTWEARASELRVLVEQLRR